VSKTITAAEFVAPYEFTFTMPANNVTLSATAQPMPQLDGIAFVVSDNSGFIVSPDNDGNDILEITIANGTVAYWLANNQPLTDEMLAYFNSAGGNISGNTLSISETGLAALCAGDEGWHSLTAMGSVDGSPESISIYFYMGTDNGVYGVWGWGTWDNIKYYGNYGDVTITPSTLTGNNGTYGSVSLTNVTLEYGGTWTIFDDDPPYLPDQGGTWLYIYSNGVKKGIISYSEWGHDIGHAAIVLGEGAISGFMSAYEDRLDVTGVMNYAGIGNSPGGIYGNLGGGE
jgi:hypothetical protein